MKRDVPEVTCYLCRRTFQKRIEGAAHNRNYYRCAECIEGQDNDRITNATGRNCA